MSNETATTRALQPVLGIGREPVLIEKATGRTMLAVDWEQEKVIISPEFYDSYQAQIFLIACTFTPPVVVVDEWQFVMEEARRIGVVVHDTVDCG